MPIKRFLLLFLLLPLGAHALDVNEIQNKEYEISRTQERKEELLKSEDTSFNKSYEIEKLNVMIAMDQCDLIQARDLLQFNVQEVAKLTESLNDIKAMFNNAKSQRNFCYDEASKQLDELLAMAQKYMQDNNEDIYFKRQYDVDLDLKDSLEIRREISSNLLDSMFNDIKGSLALTRAARVVNTDNQQPVVQAPPLYVQESARTKQLINQNEELALENERRQLVLDESLMMTFQPNLIAFIPLKVKNALHYFSKVGLAYEQLNNGPRPFLLARMRSEFGYALAQFEEIFALSESLEGIPAHLANDLRRIESKGRLLNLQLLERQQDVQEKKQPIDFDEWLVDFHQAVAELGYDTNRMRIDFERFLDAYNRDLSMHSQELLNNFEETDENESEEESEDE